MAEGKLKRIELVVLQNFDDAKLTAASAEDTTRILRYGISVFEYESSVIRDEIAAEFKGTISTLEMENKKLADKISRQKEDLSNHIAEFSRHLSRQIESSRDAKHEADTSRMNSEIAKMREEIAVLERAKTQLESRIETERSRMEAESTRQVQHVAEKYGGEVRELREELMSMKFANDSLTKELKDAQVRAEQDLLLSTGKSDIRIREMEIELGRRVSEASAAIRAAELSVRQELESKLSDTISKLIVELSAARLESDELRKSIAELVRGAGEKNAEVSRLTSELDQIKLISESKLREQDAKIRLEVGEGISAAASELSRARREIEEIKLQHGREVLDHIRNAHAAATEFERRLVDERARRAADDSEQMRVAREERLALQDQLRRKDEMIIELSKSSPRVGDGRIMETPDEKGAKGEERVYELLDLEFRVTLERVRKESYAGDIIMTFPEPDNMRCMIEVKNKKQVMASDIRSFERAVETQKNLRKIDAAIFVSICDVPIPHKGAFAIEECVGVPVIYMAMMHERALFHAIRTLRFMHEARRRSRGDMEDKTLRAVRDLVAALNLSVSTSISTIRAVKQKLRVMDGDLRQEDERLEAMFDQLSIFYKTYPALAKPKEMLSGADAKRIDRKSDRILPYDAGEMELLDTWVSKNRVMPTKKQIEEILGVVGITDRRSPERKELLKILMENAAKRGIRAAGQNKRRDVFTQEELIQIRNLIFQTRAIPHKSTVDKLLGLPEGNKKVLRDIGDQMARWVAEARGKDSDARGGSRRSAQDERESAQDDRMGADRSDHRSPPPADRRIDRAERFEDHVDSPRGRDAHNFTDPQDD